MSDFSVNIDANVFNDAYLPYLENTSRTQVYFGGSSSGKSWFLAQRVVWDLLAGGRNYLICRKVQKYVRGSVFAEVEKVIENWGIKHIFTIHKTNMTITCRNGYQAIFTGLDDVAKLKSITPRKGVLTDIFIEEATETVPDDLKQLNKRLRGIDVFSDMAPKKKRLTLAFNPILKSNHLYTTYFAKTGWADDQTIFGSEDLSILRTTYKDNRFLTQDDRDDLENETDRYWHEVYTLGKWGMLGNVIFENWEYLDLSGMTDQFTNPMNGLDFGFSSDPAALPRAHYDKKKKSIYIYDELYERGLTNDLLAAEIIKLIGREYVTCDSAEPKSIKELKNYKVNALAAKKGPDSVNYGIQWLKQQKIYIDLTCVNTKNEFEQYHWKEDKDGNAIKQPVDKNNHSIDGLRYGSEPESLNQSKSGFVKVRGKR